MSFCLVYLQIDKWPCPGSWARNKEPNPRKPPCSLSLGWKRFWRKVARTKWYCDGSPGKVEEVKVGKIVIESCNRARWFEWDHGGINNVGEMKKNILYIVVLDSFTILCICINYVLIVFLDVIWQYVVYILERLSKCPRQPHQCGPPYTRFPPSPISAFAHSIPRWTIVIVTLQRKEATASGTR